MSIFKKKKQEAKKMATLEEVRKAYADLSEADKKLFDEGRTVEQTEQDRIDESVGEQEKAHDEKDTQSAKDREDEALGAEHADGEGDVAELHKTDEKDEPKPEPKDDVKEEPKDEVKADEWHKGFEERLAAMELAIAELTKKGSAEAKLEESKAKYGFAPRPNTMDSGERLSPEEAIARLRKA